MIKKIHVTEAKVSDVIGPLPSGNDPDKKDCGLVVLSAGSKSFPVMGSWIEADMCHSLLKGDEVPAFFFSTHIIKAAGKQLSEITLFDLEGELWCRLFMGGKKPIKMATELVVAGINMALCGKVPILVEDSVLDRIKDSSMTYSVLKSTVPTLWPLPQLDHTPCLEALSNYLDEAGF